MDIIPAIDLINGECVRLVQGDFDQKKVYNSDPLEVAIQFEQVGVKRLHLVDLDGARTGAVVNIKVLEKIASKTNLIIDFGGGIKSDKSIEDVFNAGATIATIGSVAVKEPQLFYSWIERFGANKLLLGADVKNEMIVISGWQEATTTTVYDLISKYREVGLNQFFCTDVAKDGLLQGPATDLYKTILQKFPGVELIASGGVSNMDDIEILRAIGCSGAIVGKAIYEGKINLADLLMYNK